jgi:hypothetical protein
MEGMISYHVPVGGDLAAPNVRRFFGKDGALIVFPEANALKVLQFFCFFKPSDELFDHARRFLVFSAER